MKRLAISFGAGLVTALALGALPRGGEVHITLAFLVATALWWLLALALALVLLGRVLAKFRDWPVASWNNLLGAVAAPWAGITIGMLLAYGW